MVALSDKQERFCEEYIIDLNVFAAMVRAGYSENYANARGYEMLGNVGIQSKITELKKARSERTKINADWVLSHLVNQVESNVLDAFATVNKESFTIEDLKALPRETQMCIKKVKQNKDGIEIQFEDKQKALEMISRHIGFFEKDNEQSKTKIEFKGFNFLPGDSNATDTEKGTE